LSSATRCSIALLDPVELPNSKIFWAPGECLRDRFIVTRGLRFALSVGAFLDLVQISSGSVRIEGSDALWDRAVKFGSEDPGLTVIDDHQQMHPLGQRSFWSRAGSLEKMPDLS